MRLIIEQDAQKGAIWAARYIVSRIKAKAELTDKPFVLGLPEIKELYIAIVANHDVIRADISVQDIFFMDGLESSAYLRCHTNAIIVR